MPIFKAAENKKCGGKGGFKTSPRATLSYITRPEKAAVVSSIMLYDNKNYAEQFADTAKIWNKAQAKNSRKFYHFIHSFSPEDNISPEKAHELTEELCKKFFPHSEIVIATHNDREHIHSHIVINSVNFDNGKMLQISPKRYTAIKDYSNERTDFINAFFAVGKAFAAAFNGIKWLICKAAGVSEFIPNGVIRNILWWVIVILLTLIISALILTAIFIVGFFTIEFAKFLCDKLFLSVMLADLVIVTFLGDIVKMIIPLNLVLTFFILLLAFIVIRITVSTIIEKIKGRE